MIRKLARYRVRDGAQSDAVAAIEDFVTAIERDEPGTVYSVYRHSDGVTFTHFISFPGTVAEAAHKGAVHTRRFVDTLYPLCEEPPVFTDLALVKSSHITFD